MLSSILLVSKRKQLVLADQDSQSVVDAHIQLNYAEEPTAKQATKLNYNLLVGTIINSNIKSQRIMVSHGYSIADILLAINSAV